MKKRLLSVLLTLCMILTLLPVSAFATGTGTEAGTQTASVTNTSNNITVNKYVSGSGTTGDPYKLTLEAYASNTITTSTTTTPLDIVLVLDVSGSMTENFGNSYTYTATGSREWTARSIDDDLRNGYNRTNYDYLVDGEYRQVYVYRTGNNNSNRQYSLCYSTGQDQYVTLGGPVYGQNTTLWTGVLYQRQRTTRLLAMQSAVTTFINSVAENANKNSVPHRIAIVSFANEADTRSSLTSVQNQTGVDSLISTVNNLSAGGSTYSDNGLTRAQTVLSGAERDSKKVVVMFTDGVPGQSTNWTYDSGRTAADAITAARTLKGSSYNATVYTIGIFSGANPNETPANGNSQDPNTYMHAVSSNYPNATASSSSGGWSFNVTLGTRANGNYYFAADDAESLDAVFSGIADTVTSETLTAVPDEKAVLSDTLSQYFDFSYEIDFASDGSTVVSPYDPDVTVQYAQATAYDAETETFTFGTPESLPDGVTRESIQVEIIDNKITITGFDYEHYAVTENNDEVSGGKLVITFPILLDEAACLETSVDSGLYPTNNTAGDDSAKAGLFYKGSDESAENDTYTVLDRSPTVELNNGTITANGTDITVEVYVDGEKLTGSAGSENAPSQYIAITRPDGIYDYFALVSNDNGTLTYDFNYNPNPAVGHDCVDIAVKLQEAVADDYIVQGIQWYQSYGSGNPRPIQEATGTYTVDNVTHNSSGSDADVKIYLSSKYTVEYYVNGTVVSTLGDSAATYIAYAQTGTDGGVPTEGNDSTRFWTINASSYSTTFTLPTYTTTVGTTFDGWYLGSMSNGSQLTGNTLQSITAEADAADNTTDQTIQYYGTTSADTYKVEYAWGLPEGVTAPSSISLPSGDPDVAYNEEVSVDTTFTTNISFTDSATHTVYTFNGWKVTNSSGGEISVSEGKFNMPTSDVTITAQWTTNSEEAHSVIYTWSGLPDDETPLYNAAGTAVTLAEPADEIDRYYEGDTYTVNSTYNSNTVVYTHDAYGNVNGQYQFSGWKLSGTVVSGEQPMGSTDVTLTGEWTYTSITVGTCLVTIRYVSDDETPITLDNAVTIDPAPTPGATVDLTSYVKDTLTYDGDNYMLVGTEVNPSTVEIGEDNTFTVTGSTTITYVYTLDNWDADNNTETGGDQIADKYQVKVVYTTDGNGSIEGTQVEILTISENGEPVEEGDVTIPEWGHAVTATANNNYTFQNWTAAAEGHDGWSAPDGLRAIDETFSALSIAAYGGATYTFTAHFQANKPDLTVTKTADEDTVEVGEEIHYTVIVENTGDAILNNVEITDTLWDGSTVLNVNAPEGIDYSYANGMLTIKSLPVDAIVTITYTYETDLSDAGSVKNDVDVTSDEITTPVEDTVTVPVEEPLPEPGDIVVTKTPDRTTAQVGDTITWTITVTNEGSVVYDGLSLEDVLNGEALDIDSGEYTNVSPDRQSGVEEEPATEEPSEETGTEVTIPEEPSEETEPDVTAPEEPATEEPTTEDSTIEDSEIEEPEDASEVVDLGELTPSAPASAETAAAAAIQLFQTTVDETLSADPDNFDLYPGETVTFTVSYEVQPEDEGASLVNYVYVYDNDSEDPEMPIGGDDSEPVEVEEEANTYTLTYDANGGRGGDEVDTYDEGDTATVRSRSSVGFYRPGYSFEGWNTRADGRGTWYDAGDTIVMNENVTLYAQWDRNSSGGSDNDDNDRPEPEDPAPELDTENHIAYVSGTPEGTVEPEAYITREEVATIFFRLLTDRSRANYITDYNPFPDVDSSRWSFYAITTMNNGGIMHGYDDGNFAPSAYITRAEFAVVAAQFSDAQYSGADLFSDISGHWARDYINRAASEGWIAGYPDGSFGPNDYITRAQVMALVNEVLDRAPDADHMLDDMITWPDNADESAWYYEDVQEATNSHSYVWRNSGRTSEEWQDLITMRTFNELVRDAFAGVGIAY